MSTSTTSKLYKVFAITIDALKRCLEKSTESAPHPWADKHQDRLDQLMDRYAPSGSGVDPGTTLDLEASSADKLVFHCGFHHMDEHGFYDGWTDHTITIKPSLGRDFTLNLSGKNRNDIKTYLGDLFYEFLMTEVPTDLCGYPLEESEITLKVITFKAGVAVS